MTIPKNAGLSRLADTALEIEAERARQDGIQILTSYPVKKRGEPRRLVPNQAGIEWLESDANDFNTDTEIEEWRRGAEGYYGLHYYSTVGAVNHTYSRPMFQILERDAFHTAPQTVQGDDTCCYDFHRTWNCEAHPEVPYDRDRKLWLNPTQLAIDADMAALADSPEPGFAAVREAYEGIRQIGQQAARIQRFNPRLNRYEPDPGFTLTGTFNDDSIRPILGTDQWTLTVEGETEQASILGNGSSQTFEFVVEARSPRA